jgi:hypothetical protein
MMYISLLAIFVLIFFGLNMIAAMTSIKAPWLLRALIAGASTWLSYMYLPL